MVLAVQSRLKKYKIEERDVAADELEASEMMPKCGSPPLKYKDIP